MLGSFSSFLIGALIFIIDASILTLLIASMLGQGLGSKEPVREGFASTLLVLLAVCKTLFLLTSLFVSFRLAKVSPLPFVMGVSLGLIVFVGCMYVFQYKREISAKS
ncbi:MAG: hypothetical protein AB8G05_06595 [Oligoflexales bacterium]